MGQQRPLGVKLSYFTHFIQERGGREAFANLTTADVCNQFVIPMTKTQQVSLVELVAANSETQAFVASADWYVSHAWSYLFLETVDSLVNFFADDVAVWFCVFNNNQHRAASCDFRFWYNTFQSGLAAIQNLVMVLHPWQDPITLRRTWCVFEVYVARCVGARFEVAMPPADESAFATALVTEYQAFWDVLHNVKSANSRTTIPADRDNLFAVIEADVGFAALDRMLFSVVEQWVLDFLKRKVASTAGAERAQWLHALGSVPFHKGHYAEAKPYFYKAWKLFQATCGDRDERTLLLMTRLGYIYGRLFKPQTLWEPMLLDALSLQREVLRPGHPLIADTLHHMGLVYRHVSQYELSLYYYEQSLVMQGAEVRKDLLHLRTMNSMAVVQTKLGNYTDAVRWYVAGLNGYREAKGADHPDTVTVMANLVTLYKDEGQFERARELAADVVATRERLLGRNHDRTLAALLKLAIVYRCMGDYTTAGAVLKSMLADATTLFADKKDLVLMGQSQLGQLQFNQRLYSAAWETTHDVVRERIKLYGPSHAYSITPVYYLYWCIEPVAATDGHQERCLVVETYLRESDSWSAEWRKQLCSGCRGGLVGPIGLCDVCTFKYCSACCAQGLFKCGHDDRTYHVPPIDYISAQNFRQL
ncbi:hypothetical protein ACHHYP_07618 [Achlya hypogyna]|uniref:Mbre TPR repeat protein n=1 Tax=Achlya hypogyna TaxID=1202772 RepID=A0A1V9ZLM9_ACHHY|nr:hypothetical protein ACHHYP_07618 [Achlya hypogyna]